MVHNGIEYGDMQLIAEAYDVLRNGCGLSAPEMADIFQEWNSGELESYLIEITSKILRVKDTETGQPLIELVLDQAEQKGTGKWTSQLALDLGVPIPTIDAALAARNISARKSERVEASKRISVRTTGARCALRVEDLFIRPGHELNQGGFRSVQLEHQSQRGRAHLARRMHHSREVLEED